MKFSITKSKVSLTIYSLFLLSYMIQTSNIYNQYSSFARPLILGIFAIAYGLSFVVLISQKYTLRSAAWVLFLIILGLAVFAVNYHTDIIESLTVFNMMLMIVCSKNLEFNNAIKIDISMRVVTTFLLFFMSLFGIVTNVITSRSNGIIRAAWGYGHANRFGAAIFLIILYYTYINRNNITNKIIAFQTIGCFVVYFLSNSRTATIGILTVIVFSVSLKYYPRIKREKRKLRNVFILLLIIIGISLIYGVNHYSSQSTVFTALNKLFNSRLELATLYRDYYSITPFGAGSRVYTWNDVQTLGLSRALTSIDILYLKIFYNYGYITLIVYVYIIVFIIRYASRRDLFMLFSIVLICIISFIENQFFSPVTNIFLLVFSKKIYGDNNGDGEIVKE